MAWRLAILAVMLGGLAAGCGGGGTAQRETTYHLLAAARPGARLFLEHGCLDCHTYLGFGHRAKGAADLTDEGTKGKGIAFQIAHLKCPSCSNPGSAMPSYASLGVARLRQLAIFLEASEGGKLPATSTESLASENVKKVPTWKARNKLPDAAIPGANLFAQIGCLNCHSYLGTGGGYAGALDLSAEGSKGRTLQFQILHLQNPASQTPGSPMPPFAALGDQRIRQLATFLQDSKGGK